MNAGPEKSAADYTAEARRELQHTYDCLPSGDPRCCAQRSIAASLIVQNSLLDEIRVELRNLRHSHEHHQALHSKLVGALLDGSLVNGIRKAVPRTRPPTEAGHASTGRSNASSRSTARTT